MTSQNMLLVDFVAPVPINKLLLLFVNKILKYYFFKSTPMFKKMKDIKAEVCMAKGLVLHWHQLNFMNQKKN